MTPSLTVADTARRHQDPRVRPLTSALRTLLEEGVSRSAALRVLVDRLERSDVVVYVAYRHFTAQFSGRLAFVAAAAGRRYLFVHLDCRGSRSAQIAALGHELRHAVEIADEPNVIDGPSMARYYQRIGFDNSVRRDRTRFDSAAAIESGLRVGRELRRMDRNISEVP